MTSIAFTFSSDDFDRKVLFTYGRDEIPTWDVISREISRVFHIPQAEVSFFDEERKLVIYSEETFRAFCSTTSSTDLKLKVEPLPLSPQPSPPLPSSTTLTPLPWAKEVYDQFWIKQQEPVIQTNGISRLASDCGGHPIYVRTEYITLWELIRHDFDKRNTRTATAGKGGVIILGQPGIGKSLFLKFALLHALRQRIDTIYCVGETQCTLFSQKGVQQLKTRNVDNPGPVLALCDSNDTMSEPPPEFREEASQAYIVQATSPLYKRYENWPKYRAPWVVLMNGWDRQEADDLLKLRNEPTEPGHYTPKELFEYHSPSIRSCFLLEQKTSQGIMKDLNLDNVSTLFHNSSELGLFLNSGSYPSNKRPEGFHRFFYVSRKSGDPLALRQYHSVTSLLSNYRIANQHFVPLIAEEFAKRKLNEQRDFLHIVSAFPTIAGPVFEAYTMNWLASNDPSSLKCTLLDGTSLEIPLRLKKRLLTELTPDNIEDQAIYIPEPNFPTLDAVVVSNQRVLTLQMTVTKSSHDVKGGGIGQVWNMFRDRARTYSWYFIFCVRTQEDGTRLANSNAAAESFRTPAPPTARPAGERRAQSRIGLRVGYAILEEITSMSFKEFLHVVPDNTDKSNINETLEELDEFDQDVDQNVDMSVQPDSLDEEPSTRQKRPFETPADDEQRDPKRREQ